MAVSTNPNVTGISTPVRRLHTSYTQYTTTTTGSERAMSYSMPGGTLARDGQVLRVKAWGFLAANGNTKVAQIVFGATATTLLNSSGNNISWVMTADIVRRSATTQFVYYPTQSGSGLGALVKAAPSETLSGNVTIAVDVLTASAAGDITVDGMLVELLE